MHDSRGAEVKVGDHVLIEAEVVQVATGGDENYCVADVQVVTPDQPGKEKVMPPPKVTSLSTRMLTKVGLFLSMFLVASSTASADGTIAEGSTIDGYVYKGGYFYNGTQAYLRYKEWWQENVHYRTPYYHYKYEWKWRWKYDPVTTAVAYPPPLPTVPDVPDDFEKTALKILHKQQRLATYMEVFTLLGGKAAPYANGVPYSSYQNYAYGVGGTAVLSGNTAYVRTTQSKADYYGAAADIGAQALLFGQQFGALSANAQGYGDKALERYAEFNARHQQLMGILAKAEQAKIVIEALNKEPSRLIIQQRVNEPFIPATPKQPGLLPRGNDDARLQQFGEVVGMYCGKCHGADPKTIKGGLDLRDWPNFTPQRKAAVLARVQLPAGDPKHMPPAGEPQLEAAHRSMFQN